MWKTISGAHNYTLHLLYLDSGTTHPKWCAARVMLYTSTWDRRTLFLRDKGRCAHSPVHGSPEPKYAVREGLLALAADMRPEATLLISLWVSMHRNPWKGVIIYVGRVSVGRRHKSLTQCRIAKLVWWGINNFKLLLYCDKALISLYDVRRSNYWTNDKQDV